MLLSVNQILSVLTPLVTAFTVYLFSRKTEKKQSLFKMHEERVIPTINDIFFEMVELRIQMKKDPNFKENLLSYLEKLIFEEKKISSLNNPQLTEEIFKLMILCKFENNLEKIKSEFNKICEKIEKEYWEVFFINSKEYQWWKSSVNLSVWKRVSLTILYKTKDLTESCSTVLGIILAFMTMDRLINGNEALFPKDLLILNVYLFVTIVGVFILTGIISSVVTTFERKKINVLEELEKVDL
ncbi:hypothetical protein ABES80_00990 [Bacillus gobiensis]|uniref:hypothetical protein n=1 Tax=Bacillus gobiensis TaxID=1441095 RepID=UPI003D1FD9C9